MGGEGRYVYDWVVHCWVMVWIAWNWQGWFDLALALAAAFFGFFAAAASRLGRHRSGLPRPSHTYFSHQR